MRERETKSRALAKSFRRRLTDAEAILWSHLKGRQVNGLHFRPQHPIGPFVADFACRECMLVIELDGEQHGFARNAAHDDRRDSFIREKGWRIVRFHNVDVYENLEGVLEGLGELLVPPPSASLTPPPLAGEEKTRVNLSAPVNEGGKESP